MNLYKIYANGKASYYREERETFERITADDFKKTIAERKYKLTGYADEYGNRLLIYIYSKSST